jgi:hypothetical protein
MAIYGKTLKEYFVASKVFLLPAFLIAVIQVLLLQLKIISLNSIYMSIFGWIKLLLIVLAGWFLVKKHNFQLRQVFIVGCLFFLLVIFWPLLFLTKIFTLLGLIYISVINFVIVTLAILFCGWLAKKFNKK